MSEIIKVPSRLDVNKSIEFAYFLQNKEVSADIVFDFSSMGWTAPFGLIYTCQAIRRFTQRLGAYKATAIGWQKHGYQSHVGFFQACGIDVGNKPGEALGGDNYLPITERRVADLFNEARMQDKAVGEIVDTDSARISKVLTRTESGPLFETVQYSLRELLRNAAEHSESETIMFFAQYWPTKERCEIAMMDSGVGIRRTLERNPNLVMQSDTDALKLAIMPGISGTMYEGVEYKPYDEWQNSGYGLYMISRICRLAGSAFIATNNGALALVRDRHEPIEHSFLPGTAIRLNLDTSKIEPLKNQLRLFAREGQEIAANLEGVRAVKASAASLMLRAQEQ